MKLNPILIIISLVACTTESSHWYSRFIPKSTKDQLISIRHEDRNYFDKDVYKNLTEKINKNYKLDNGYGVEAGDFFYKSLQGFINAVDNYNLIDDKIKYFNMNESDFKIFDKILINIYKNAFTNPKQKIILEAMEDINIQSLAKLKGNEKKFIEFCNIYFINCLFNGKKHFAKSNILKRFYELNINNMRFDSFPENFTIISKDGEEVTSVVYEALGYLLFMVKNFNFNKK